MTVTERFLKYVSFDTKSDENSLTVPSDPKEKLLGAVLAQELQEIGLTDVEMDEFGYVYGVLPANAEAPSIGLIAHMDTSPAVSGKDVKPRIVSYAGGDIPLNDTVIMRTADFPYLEKFVGQELIVTDGTTLLGADDKAGVAEIFAAVEYLKNHPEIPHGRIAVGITPDEEIGCGADHFDLKRFACDFAYTVDGGFLGEIEYENFNAAAAKITVNGVSIHPGSAKNKMKNAGLIACRLITMLPEAEAPAHTEGYEGFYHLSDMAGDETTTKINLIIRDHDRAKFEERKAFITNLCAYLNSVYGEGTVVLDLRDTYYNMKEKIEPVMFVIDRAKKAMTDAGVEPIIVPIRGGTDGARLSYEGLPCPNLSTGGANFHGVHEFVSVQAMEKMVEVLVNLVKVQ